MIEEATITEGGKANGGLFLRLVRITGAFWILYHFLYISDFFTYLRIPVPPYLHTSAHLAGFLFFAYLLVPAKKGVQRNLPPWYDIILAILSIIPPIYYGIFIGPVDDFIAGLIKPEWSVMGWLLIVLVLEMVRRVYGYIFLGIVVFFIVYALTASHWPGF